MTTIPAYPLGVLPKFEPFFEVLRRDAELRRVTQSVPYASTITPDAQAGEVLIVGTLTGDLTANAPVGSRDGARLYFQFTQDSTGGHTVTFDSVFQQSWTTSESVGAVSTVNFRYDSAKKQWIQGSMALLAIADASTSVQTGLITYDRDPLPPFAVTSGSDVVTNLDADYLDSQHGAYYRDASNMNAGTFPDARLAESNITQHEEALTILESQIIDGSVLARVGSAETITEIWAFNGGTSGASAPFTVDSTYLVTNLNADLLDGQTGSYYLDSDNFTGTEWDDLTDSGGTTLHTHALNNITNPTGNKTFNMTTRQLGFLWTNPSGHPFELEVSGGYSGAVLHIHQHTGNPGVGTYLILIESTDTDVHQFISISPAANT